MSPCEQKNEATCNKDKSCSGKQLYHIQMYSIDMLSRACTKCLKQTINITIIVCILCRPSLKMVACNYVKNKNLFHIIPVIIT